MLLRAGANRASSASLPIPERESDPEVQRSLAGISPLTGDGLADA